MIMVIVILCAALAGGSYMYYQLKQDNNRISNNFRQVQKVNSTLILTQSEFKEQLRTVNSTLDSTLKANKIRANRVTEVQTVKTIYKDSTVYVYALTPSLDTVVKSGGISFTLKAYGLETISVSDIQSKNTTTLICYYKVRWIFFKRYDYKLLTDYGESEIDRIIVKKK